MLCTPVGGATVDSAGNGAVIGVQCRGPVTAAFKVISESFPYGLGRWRGFRLSLGATSQCIFLVPVTCMEFQDGVQ